MFHLLYCSLLYVYVQEIGEVIISAIIIPLLVCPLRQDLFANGYHRSITLCGIHISMVILSQVAELR